MGGPIPPSPIFFLAVSYGRAAAPLASSKKIGAPPRPPNFLTLVRRGKEDSTHGSIFFLCGRCPREKKCKSQSVISCDNKIIALFLRMQFRSRDFHHANNFNHPFFAIVVPLARLLRMGRLRLFWSLELPLFRNLLSTGGPSSMHWLCIPIFPESFSKSPGPPAPAINPGFFPREETLISHSYQNFKNKLHQKNKIKKNTVRHCRTAPKL